ncbi:hypothetical protein AUP68_11966 [Ilyonectria robusta]
MEDWKKEVGAALKGVASFANHKSTDRLHYRRGPTQGPGPTTEYKAHYDHITPYLGKTNQRFRQVEITAVTPHFGYITAVQRVDGTAADGSPYDFSFRSTSMVRKVEGVWKYVHEHYSFPVDMATKIADFTGKQGATESVEFKKK